MPYLGGCLSPYGIYHNEMLAGSREVIFPLIAWIWITIFTVVASIVILIFILSKIKYLFLLLSYNEFFRQKMIKLFLFMSLILGGISALWTLGRTWIFKIMKIWYNYLYNDVQVFDVLKRQNPYSYPHKKQCLYLLIYSYDKVRKENL